MWFPVVVSKTALSPERRKSVETPQNPRVLFELAPLKVVIVLTQQASSAQSFSVLQLVLFWAVPTTFPFEVTVKL